MHEVSPTYTLRPVLILVKTYCDQSFLSLLYFTFYYQTILGRFKTFSVFVACYLCMLILYRVSQLQLSLGIFMLNIDKAKRNKPIMLQR